MDRHQQCTPSDASELCCTVQYIHSTNAVWGNTMATTKTTTLTFRIEPGLKEAVRTAAEQEHRSIANMIEIMIRDYCGRVGVEVVTAELKKVDRVSAKQTKQLRKI